MLGSLLLLLYFYYLLQYLLLLILHLDPGSPSISTHFAWHIIDTIAFASAAMGSGSLPSPPAEDHKSTLSRKSTSSSTKSVKPVHRTSKRASSSAATIHHHDHVTHTTGMDGRHKRVWKACERCRMKKTKARFLVLCILSPLSTNTGSSVTANFPASDARTMV